jgi:outer membrane phospholipase A
MLAISIILTVKKNAESRSIDRIFVRGIYLTTFIHHNLDFNLMIFNIFNKDHTNKDIAIYLGYWDLKMTFNDLITHHEQNLDLAFRLFSGKKYYNINHGGYQIGLIYKQGSTQMNPSIYFQIFKGYAENLLEHKVFHSSYRLGFLLSY